MIFVRLSPPTPPITGFQGCVIILAFQSYFAFFAFFKHIGSIMIFQTATASKSGKEICFRTYKTFIIRIKILVNKPCEREAPFKTRYITYPHAEQITFPLDPFMASYTATLVFPKTQKWSVLRKSYQVSQRFFPHSPNSSIHSLRCFDAVSQRPYRCFSIALKVILSLFDRHKISTSDWLWIEVCENAVFSKVDVTITTINKKL